MDNGDKILSQEEIDALMSQKQDEDDDYDMMLTDEEKDVLGEIGNIAMGSAATALFNILDQKVQITTPEVNVEEFSEITDQYTRPCVLVKVEYIAGIEGVNLLIIKEEDAAIIADLMMGGDGTDPDMELDEIRLSAVGEAMNQMMGSSSTALSSIIDDVVNISPPETQYLQLEEAIDNGEKYFGQNDLLVDTSFQLKIGDLVDSSFKQLAELDFTKQLVARLTGSGLTAKEEIPEEELDEPEVTISEGLEEEKESSIKERKTEPEPASEPEPESEYESEPEPEPAYSVSHKKRRDVSQDSVGVKRAQFPDFDNSTAAPLPQNMELIHDVPLQVTVRLGKSRMTIKEILDLGEGSIIELDKLAGEPVDLLVNGKLIAKGEVVVIDENFGFRVKDIISPMERLNNI